MTSLVAADYGSSTDDSASEDETNEDVTSTSGSDSEENNT